MYKIGSIAKNKSYSDAVAYFRELPFKNPSKTLIN